ncbi:Scfd2 [Phodopus roborovskii]|uniref:Scfd2 protein n=1 Tax=Phodopus roborovskii TaxID=109678 RepID=A0AAU9ZUM9_PHORO|nr:Scfd2 [Phodopus roborovskii]
MSSAGVLSFAQQCWEQVLAKVKWSVVYLDAACAESLHWSCGSSRLLEAVKGPACNLREFEPQAIGGGAQQPRAVFVLSCLLKGQTVDTLRDIIRRSHFQYCVVVTAVSHAVHLTANHVPAAAAAELEGQQPVFEQLEEKLREWMGNMNYMAEVLHVPLLLAPAAPHLAFTPAFGTLFPLLPRDVHLLNSARPDKRRLVSLSEVDATALPPELLLHIRCLVSGLSSLCEHLGVREECFAVGSLSRIIATDLANYAPAKNRKKTAAGRASVVFVDRTLDLTGAVGHHGDSLVEKILSVLPQLPGHTSDVMVNMTELTAVQMVEENQTVIAPGCLAQSKSSRSSLPNEVSLCYISGCPGTCSVDQVGLELTEICLPLPPECWTDGFIGIKSGILHIYLVIYLLIYFYLTSLPGTTVISSVNIFQNVLLCQAHPHESCKYKKTCELLHICQDSYSNESSLRSLTDILIVARVFISFYIPTRVLPPTPLPASLCLPASSPQVHSSSQVRASMRSQQSLIE